MLHLGRFNIFYSSVKTANLDISGTPAGVSRSRTETGKAMDTCQVKMTA